MKARRAIISALSVALALGCEGSGTSSGAHASPLSPAASCADRAGAPRTRTAQRARYAARVAFAQCSPHRPDASAFSDARIAPVRRTRCAALRASASLRPVWVGSIVARASSARAAPDRSPPTRMVASRRAAPPTVTHVRPATGAPARRREQTITDARRGLAIRRVPQRALPTWSATRRRAT